ncbi:DUF1566 domain-containing protein [Leptospira langatensis]|nr:DUF1566 domain-containing protein [Leptospira langatensis]
MLGQLAECAVEPSTAPPTILYKKNLLNSVDFYFGFPGSFNPTVTGAGPVTYSISTGALPAGLSFNTSNGQISGTPTATAVLTSFGVTATNTFGNSTDTFYISVWDPSAIPDTGKATCTDNTGTGTSCAGQDGEFSNIPGFRSYNGPVPHPTYTNQQASVDMIRGLYWKTCSEGQADPTCSGTPTLGDWTWASNVCSNLNVAPGYAGFTTWRLPTMKELLTLVYLGSSTPLVESTYFPNSGASGYWTSTQNADSSVQAYAIDFNLGSSMSYNKASSFAVRCVSGRTMSEPSFVDQGNGIVLEQGSQIYFQKCNNGETYTAGACGTGANTIDWETAVAICDSFVLGGFNWRLPNLDELHLLTDYTDTSDPKIYSVFNSTASAAYWTSSSQGGGVQENQAYANLADTREMALQTKTNFLYFRCVSSGP